MTSDAVLLRTAAEDALPLEEEAPSTWSLLEIHSARPDWIRLSFPALAEAAVQLEDFLNWFFMDHPEKIREAVQTAARSLLESAMEWRKNSGPAHRVRAAILVGRRALLCWVANPGNGFRSQNLIHAALCVPGSGPCEHFSRRKRKRKQKAESGLTILRGRTDHLIYNQTGQEMILLRYLGPSEPQTAI